jgi:hypothetical protein
VLEVTKVGPSEASVTSPITFAVTAGVAPGSPPAAPLVLVEELSNNKAAFELPLPDAGECILPSYYKVCYCYN